MTERRDFLKVASLLPFGAEAGATSGVGAAAKNDAGGLTPPQLPPVQEQPFANYHLLGTPEEHESLFGGIRPHDWSGTKRELEKALGDAAHAQDPIHAWLKTFKPTFDDRATKIILGATGRVNKEPGSKLLRYEPQLYEASLRSASVLLDRCLRYRNEMGSFELAGVSAGISYLTFIKLKPIQRNLIILSNSKDLAEIEHYAQANACLDYREAKGLDKLFDKYHLRGLHSEAEGSAWEADRAADKDQLRTDLLEKQFHIQTDAQLAQFTRLLTSGSASNYAERYLRMHSMLVEDLADAYCKLYSASKGVQSVLALSKFTVGLGSKQTNVDVDIEQFTSEEQLKKWVQTVVPPNPVVPPYPEEGDQRKPDVLDALVLWSRAVMRELDRRSQYETEITVAIPLTQLTATDFNNAFNPPKGTAPTYQVAFDIASSDLPFAFPELQPASTVPRSLRVIGIGLSVGQAGGPTTATFQAIAPARLDATVTTPQQDVAGVDKYPRPPVFLSNVRIEGGTSSDLEPVLSYDPVCRNVYPIGNWTISLNKNVVEFIQTTVTATTPFSETWISGLILHLRLRGAAAA